MQGKRGEERSFLQLVTAKMNVHLHDSTHKRLTKELRNIQNEKPVALPHLSQPPSMSIELVPGLTSLPSIVFARGFLEEIQNSDLPNSEGKE